MTNDGHNQPRGCRRGEEVQRAGFIGSTMGEKKSGGMQLLSSVAFAAFAWFAAANVGSAYYPVLTMGGQSHHQSRHRRADRHVRAPDGRGVTSNHVPVGAAGDSSLADVATRAEEVGDGTYRLFGNKMWISGGDHELTENIVHLVLARIPGRLRESRAVAVHRPEVPDQRRWQPAASVTMLPSAGLQPQDGSARNHEYAAELWVRGSFAWWAGGAVITSLGSPTVNLAHMFHT